MSVSMPQDVARLPPAVCSISHDVGSEPPTMTVLGISSMTAATSAFPAWAPHEPTGLLVSA